MGRIVRSEPGGFLEFGDFRSTEPLFCRVEAHGFPIDRKAAFRAVIIPDRQVDQNLVFFHKANGKDG